MITKIQNNIDKAKFTNVIVRKKNLDIETSFKA